MTKHFNPWAQTKAGRAHGRRAITAHNASPGAIERATAVLARIAADPLCQARRKLGTAMALLARAATAGDLDLASKRLEEALAARLELARLVVARAGE
jgi:thioredoxin-like negative regulator of GroEL